MNDAHQSSRTQQDVHTTTPTVPFKRKYFHLRDPTPPRTAAPAPAPSTPAPASSSLPYPPPSTPTASSSAPKSAAQPPQNLPTSTVTDSDSIQCICGFTNDDGWSIGCDECPRWCHGICMGFTEKDQESLPESWWCWVCKPRFIDGERARRIQMARMGLGSNAGPIGGYVGAPSSIGPIVGWENGNGEQNGRTNHHRRSPGVERKPRKPSAAAEGFDGKRRRRMSSAVGGGISPTVPTSTLHGEDEHVTIDDDAALTSYVDISNDIYQPPPPKFDTRDQLRRQAHSWRGVTAIGPSQPPYHNLQPIPISHPPPPPSQHPIALHQLPPQSQYIPPAYSVHTTRPIPSQSFITTYPAVITPTAEYLKDPLNAYALLGMPKPYVHLVGGVALDARWCGGKARFVRSGCRPNAVIRPVICRRKASKKDRKGKGKAREGEGEDVVMESEGEAGDGEGEGNDDFSFALFALNDLRANEEVVLGWEWDDGNIVHQLPALIGGEGVRTDGKSRQHFNLPHIKAQMSNILHALQSTFTTCACGNSSRNCVLQRMREFVEAPGPSIPCEAPPPATTTPGVPMTPGYFPPFPHHHPHPQTPFMPFTPHTPFTPYPVMMTPGLPFPPPTPTPEPPAIPDTPISSLPPHLHHSSVKSASPSVPPPTAPTPSVVSLPSFVAAREDFLAARRVSEGQEGEKPTESRDPLPESTTTTTNEIWGPKTRLTNRQKHPTLNLTILRSEFGLGPLIGAKRGVKAREKVPGSGGLGGCEMWPYEEEFDDLRDMREKDREREKTPPPVSVRGDVPGLVADPGSPSPSRPVKKKELRALGVGSLDGGYWGRRGSEKGKEKAVEEEEEKDGGEGQGALRPRTRRRTRSKAQTRTDGDGDEEGDEDVEMDGPTADPPQRSPSPPPLVEEKMPPKMRKRRIQREAKALAEREAVRAHEGATKEVNGIFVGDQGMDPRQYLERTQSQLEMPPPPVPVSASNGRRSRSASLSPPPSISFIHPTPSPSSATASTKSPSPVLPETTAVEKSSSPVDGSSALPTPPVSSDGQKPSADGSNSRASSVTTEIIPLGSSPPPPPPPEHEDSPLHTWEPMTRREESNVTITKEVKQELMEDIAAIGREEDEADDVDMEESVEDEEAPSSPLSSPPPDTLIGGNENDNEEEEEDKMEVDVAEVTRARSRSSTPKSTPEDSIAPEQTVVIEPVPTVEEASTQPEPPTIAVVESDLAPSTSAGHGFISSPLPTLTPSPLLQLPTELPTLTTPSPSVLSNISLPVSPQLSQVALSPTPSTPDLGGGPLKKQKMSLKDFALRKKLRREAEEAQAAAKVASESTPANAVNETREKESASAGEAVKEICSDVIVVDAGAGAKEIREEKEEVPVVPDITQRSPSPPVSVIPVLAAEDRPQSEEPMEAETVPETVEEAGEVAPEPEVVESSDDERDPPELVPRMPGIERSRSRMDLNSLLSPAPTTQSPPVSKTPESPADNHSLNLNGAVNGTTSAAADVDMESSPVVVDASPPIPPPQTEPPVLSIVTTAAPVSTRTKSTPPSDSAVAASSTASTRASTPGPTPTTPATQKPKSLAQDPPKSASTSLPNPPRTLIHKLPPKPAVGPPPTTGIITGSDAIKSIAHPSVLPGAKKEKEKELERSSTPESRPRGHVSHLSWDKREREREREREAEKRKWREEAEEKRREVERQRQREIDEEIDRERIESDKRYMRRREQVTRSYSTDLDGGSRGRGEGMWYRRSGGRWDSRSPDGRRYSPSPERDSRRYSPPPRGRRRRSSTSSSRISSSRSRSRSPLRTISRSRSRTRPPRSPSSPPPRKASAPTTSTFFPKDSRTASPAPIYVSPSIHTPIHPPPPPPTSFISNPKWSSNNMVAADPKGGSSFSFNHAPPSTAPPQFSSPPPPPSIPPPTAPSTPTPAPPLPGFVQSVRAKSPPTQPRSFANPTREPPKGPRALMIQQGQGRLGGAGPNNRIREWDRDKFAYQNATGDAWSGNGNDFWNDGRRRS
ncbi:SET domain-containing protein 3 [Marasmius sp. AFHP31]|nr:SET domain-containing protein 3 [Marasmius sp. AFHP31]